MDDLEKIKLEEKIDLLRSEHSALTKQRLLLDWVKTVAIILGAIIVFFAIRAPESWSNLKQANEEMTRARIKMVLEYLKEDDPVKKAEALALIRTLYKGVDDEWVDRLDDVIAGLSNSEVFETYYIQFKILHEMREQLGGELSNLLPDPGRDEMIRAKIESVEAKLSYVKDRMILALSGN